jgi:transcriptional regulator with XRE-family HTH domain
MMTEEHWPTLEETEAEDRAAGRLDEAAIAVHRQLMRDAQRAYQLAEIRKSMGLTQTDVAEAMHVSQRRVSAVEHGDLTRTNLGTVATYVAALGGRIEIVANIGEQRIIIGLMHEKIGAGSPPGAEEHKQVALRGKGTVARLDANPAPYEFRRPGEPRSIPPEPGRSRADGEPEIRSETVQAIFSALVDMDPLKLVPLVESGIRITAAERRRADELYLASIIAGFDQRERRLQAMQVLIGDREFSAPPTWAELFSGLTPERRAQLSDLYDALPDGARAEYDRRYGHPKDI